MSVWILIRNAGTIIQLFKAISSIIEKVAKKESPDRTQVKVLLDRVQALLDSGAIDIPGVDEKAISAALQQIEDELCG